MFKTFLICLAISTVSVNSQLLGIFGFGNIAGGIFNGLNATVGIGINSGFLNRRVDLHNTVLQLTSNVLSSQNVPEDLQARLSETLAKAQEAFKECEESIFWQYRRCTTTELMKAVSEIRSIENEAKQRQLASTTLPSPVTLPFEKEADTTTIPPETTTVNVKEVQA